MWQILNLNKRLEGLETATREMTNFVNNIHSSLEDLKRIPNDATPSNKISAPEETINRIAECVRQLGEKLLELEEKLSVFPTKAELKGACTVDKVVALIKEYSDLFKNENKDEIRTNKDENKEPNKMVFVKKLEYSDEKQNLDAKEVKISNTSISNAFSNKADFLEENIATVKEKMDQLETGLASKPDMQLFIDLKTELREVSFFFLIFTKLKPQKHFFGLFLT